MLGLGNGKEVQATGAHSEKLKRRIQRDRRLRRSVMTSRFIGQQRPSSKSKQSSCSAARAASPRAPKT